MFALRTVLLLLTLVSVSKSVIFHCAFLNNDWGLGEFYTCAPTIDISKGTETVVDVTGEHLDGRTNADVAYLFVMNQNVLDRIPSGIEQFFPNLMGMQWYLGSLTALRAEDLEPFRNLIELVVWDNRIVLIDGNLFQHNPNLKKIYFQNNLLEHVGQDLLTGLSKLDTADFMNNPCINVRATTRAEIQELNHQLPIMCPQPLCSLGCSIRIESLEVEVAEYKDKVDELTQVIESYEQRLAYVEEQIRELLERPCLNCD